MKINQFKYLTRARYFVSKVIQKREVLIYSPTCKKIIKIEGDW
jgi:hypothetical protein